ncbi:putative bifunctional methylthioribulose-1-phosphate dehydratase/enolase-phosphatase E1 1 [Trichinella nelsoni]|uniref:Putative bifunctional methylthioribulose-1-phosphate dehydratase/enolase-phosphatase E1 1 n=1 Tax=Trichinella nelsoni TaxID=6336 RepID=A0A0V0RAI4_9BILA|nr:putative bifunctional methylthioribulose-1-phosphate dehydratase/enolase-phosphatase E1 1 [Trichinella nelsoni]
MIKADRKITALKQLQGHIWRTGFEKNELKVVVGWPKGSYLATRTMGI